MSERDCASVCMCVAIRVFEVCVFALGKVHGGDGDDDGDGDGDGDGDDDGDGDGDGDDDGDDGDNDGDDNYNNGDKCSDGMGNGCHLVFSHRNLPATAFSDGENSDVHFPRPRARGTGKS